MVHHRRDESDRTFLSLGAEIAIVTNVEPDHLETYDNDPEQLLAAFVQFADAATTPIYCADDAGAMQVASAVPGITYGTAEHADYRMVDIATGRASVAFTIRHDGAEVARVELPTPGMHNARNAAAAFVATIAAGGSAAAAAAALARFGGVARRFEFRGEIDGVTFVDDYAHLPTEVEAALAAAADGGWERIVCVFQPHRYSRTAALWQDFADGFVGADVLVVTDIYASGKPAPWHHRQAHRRCRARRTSLVHRGLDAALDTRPDGWPTDCVPVISVSRWAPVISPACRIR